MVIQLKNKLVKDTLFTTSCDRFVPRAVGGWQITAQVQAQCQLLNLPLDNNTDLRDQFQAQVSGAMVLRQCHQLSSEQVFSALLAGIPGQRVKQLRVLVAVVPGWIITKFDVCSRCAGGTMTQATCWEIWPHLWTRASRPTKYPALVTPPSPPSSPLPPHPSLLAIVYVCDRALSLKPLAVALFFPVVTDLIVHVNVPRQALKRLTRTLVKKTYFSSYAQ